MILLGEKDLPSRPTSLKPDPFFEATNNLSFLAISVFMTSEFPKCVNNKHCWQKKLLLKAFAIGTTGLAMANEFLKRIFDDFVATGSPNIPFCMGWVNENWIGKWHGLEIIIIFEKNYPGVDDHKDHVGCWLPAS
jgi:hypothetical protein